MIDLPRAWKPIVGGGRTRCADQNAVSARGGGGSKTVLVGDVVADEDRDGAHIGRLAHQPRHGPSLVGLHRRSEEHTSELQSLMRTSYAVFCLKTKINHKAHN